MLARLQHCSLAMRNSLKEQSYKLECFAFQGLRHNANAIDIAVVANPNANRLLQVRAAQSDQLPLNCVKD